ncbi:Beta-lactamase [Nonomuraea solani]|uniref:Beta-lactamase n=1 Tax=Nonomuraea solani TaxID=1144553 RepID=A0A1H6DW47_9ACTN|nr:serine hydrolase domain-containing protein [Nonomuraea solani]SEG89304.1 Beta-lactamase [Nonomuraea solani]
MVDDGEIKLDGPVADCLPEFKLDRRITARMLLQHTSGLYNYTSWSYSNTGYTLARLLIEKVTGHSITYGDTAPDLAKARDNLLKQVFCGGSADKAKSAR